VPLKIAIVGCGAVSAVGHLPALALQRRFEAAALVDVDRVRATELAAQFCVAGVYTSYRDVIGKVDAAIVALPNSLHAPVATDLLKAGIHVLVEKPMATRSEDCASMIDAARTAERRLVVGMVRRLFPMSAFVQEIIDNGAFGPLQTFDIQEGSEFRSPVASVAAFRADLSGGGVLMDTGVHVLDSLHLWLGGLRVESYSDDSEGGVEANCVATLSTALGATGRVELSRTRNLRNTLKLQFASAALEIGIGPEARVRLSSPSGQWELSGIVGRQEGATYVSMMALQLERFAALIHGEDPQPPGVAGADVAIRTIEECYANRHGLGVPGMPWMPRELRPGD
jgi:predicted dehydrogenase